MFFPVPPKRDEPAAAAQPPATPAPDPAADPPPPSPPEADPIDARDYTFAAEQLIAGAPGSDIEANLMRNGRTPEAAAGILADVRRIRAEALRQVGGRNVRLGALWCGGGLLVTIVTYQVAEGGGVFVLAWGAIVFGAVQFIRGLIQKSDARAAKF